MARTSSVLLASALLLVGGISGAQATWHCTTCPWPGCTNQCCLECSGTYLIGCTDECGCWMKCANNAVSGPASTVGAMQEINIATSAPTLGDAVDFFSSLSGITMTLASGIDPDQTLSSNQYEETTWPAVLQNLLTQAGLDWHVEEDGSWLIQEN